MANQQDIDRAVERAREAIKQQALPVAKAALEELAELVMVFQAAHDKAPSPALKERAAELHDGARACLAELKGSLDELELDQLDPKHAERVKAREAEAKAKDEAGRAKAAQFLQGMGGPFASLAGLVNLGATFGQKVGEAAGSAMSSAQSGVHQVAVATAGEIACPSCSEKNPRRARFCMECGSKLARGCGACGAELGKAKFCPECGAKA